MGSHLKESRKHANIKRRKDVKLSEFFRTFFTGGGGPPICNESFFGGIDHLWTLASMISRTSYSNIVCKFANILPKKYQVVNSGISRRYRIVVAQIWLALMPLWLPLSYKEKVKSAPSIYIHPWVYWYWPSLFSLHLWQVSQWLSHQDPTFPMLKSLPFVVCQSVWSCPPWPPNSFPRPRPPHRRKSLHFVASRLCYGNSPSSFVAGIAPEYPKAIGKF